MNNKSLNIAMREMYLATFIIKDAKGKLDYHATRDAYLSARAKLDKLFKIE